MKNHQEETAPIETEEEIPDDFHCCVCLELLYKPVVLSCGHISCFWCIFMAMERQESHCPMCRHRYYHFPSICHLLNSVLLQLYPIAYKKRERQITEQEQSSEFFSPQMDNHLSASKPRKELNILDGAPPYSNEDLICAACEKLLYRPVVLNCGHVYCEACIIGSDNNPKCRICGSAHPSGYLKVCLVLEQFLEKQFFEQYTDRKKDVVKQVGTENGSQACSSNSQTNAMQLSSHPTNRHLLGVKVHCGFGCDYCGIFPIVGERYKCVDCRERAGFDLCEGCYNTPPNIKGRFNQQHKPDHRLEIVQPEHNNDTDSEEDYSQGIYPDNTSEEGTDSAI